MSLKRQKWCPNCNEQRITTEIQPTKEDDHRANTLNMPIDPTVSPFNMEPMHCNIRRSHCHSCNFEWMTLEVPYEEMERHFNRVDNLVSLSNRLTTKVAEMVEFIEDED